MRWVSTFREPLTRCWAIEKCWLQDDISNRIRNAVRDYAYEHDYSFINLRTQEGMLRNMIVRTSSTGELMVIVICKITEDHEMELFNSYSNS